MNQSPGLDRVRQCWAELAGCPGGFDSAGVTISVAEHRVAPDGWIGAVTLGEAAVLALGPDNQHLVEEIDTGGLRVADLADRAAIEAVCGPVVDSLGPASLAFGLTDEESPAHTHDCLGPLPASHELVQAVANAATSAERSESAIEESKAGLFVAFDGGGNPAATCGYQSIMNTIAHIGVLTVPKARNRGYARRAAAAAIAHAREAGLIPQWRATLSNQPSLAVADRLGLTRVGRQFSFQLA